MDKNLPVFVKINDYKDVLDVVDVMKQKLKETTQTLNKIKALKIEEDKELQEWEKNVTEISRRLAFIDSAFFENE
jgi:virulence-associated protein VapD